MRVTMGNGTQRKKSRIFTGVIGFGIISVFMLATFLTLISFSVQASQLEVCRIGCSFDSIDAAVKAASSGDRLNINAGTYRENVTITKSLELFSAGKGEVVISLEKEGNPVLTFTGSGLEVTIRDLTISVSSGSPVDREASLYPDGLSVNGSVELKLLNVIVSDNEGCGVRLLESSKVEIIGSNLARNGFACCGSSASTLSVEDSSVTGNGVSLSGNAFAAIGNSTISNHDKLGLELLGSARATVSDSRIGTCETCVLLTEDSRISITDSTVRDAGDGIKLMKKSLIDISDSEITDCTSGLELHGSTSAFIKDSEVTRNDHGLSLFDSASLTVRNCRIASNDIGIRSNHGSKTGVTGCDVKFYNNFDADTDGLKEGVTDLIQDRCGG